MKKPRPHRSVGPVFIQHASDIDWVFQVSKAAGYPLTCPQSLPNGSHQQSPRESELAPSQVYMPVYSLFSPTCWLVGWLVVFFMQSQFLKPTSVMNPVWISLHLIINLKTDSGGAIFCFVLLWFHPGFIWFWFISAGFQFLGFMWNTSWLRWFFWASAGLILLWVLSFAFVNMGTSASVDGWRLCSFIYFLFLLYLCLTEPTESAQGQYLCEAQ